MSAAKIFLTKKEWNAIKAEKAKLRNELRLTRIMGTVAILALLSVILISSRVCGS